MIRIKWDLEEAVARYDVYFKSGQTLTVDEKYFQKLSAVMNSKAKIKGLIIDDRFRNITGLSMQIGCIHYVVTGGKERLSNASKVLYDAYDLYKKEPNKFNAIVDEFYSKYD